MAVLLSLSSQTTSESSQITLTSSSPLQILVNGDLAGGQVAVLIRGSNGTFYDYPDLSFNNRAAVSVTLMSGDVIKAVFRGCKSAGIEIRQ